MSWTFWRSGLTIFVLAATLIASRAVDFRPPESLAQPLETIERNVNDWTGTDDPPIQDVRVLRELRPTTYLSRTYRRGDKSLNLSVVYYAQQRAGESMHSPKNCLPAGGWEAWDHSMVKMLIDGRSIDINMYLVQRAGSRALVLYWYQSRRRIVASEIEGKVLLIRDAVLEGRTGGSIVRLTLRDAPGALEDGTAFASAIVPQLQRCLGR